MSFAPFLLRSLLGPPSRTPWTRMSLHRVTHVCPSSPSNLHRLSHHLTTSPCNLFQSNYPFTPFKSPGIITSGNLTYNIRYLNYNKKDSPTVDAKEKGSPETSKSIEEDELTFDQELAKLSLLERYKKLLKMYWYVLVPLHGVTSIMWFSSCYFAVRSGLELDVVGIMETLHFPDLMITPLKHPAVGSLAIALGFYKLATPLRYMSTVYAAVPTIKFLVRKNWIKPVPSREKIQMVVDAEVKKLKNKITPKRGS